MYKVLFWFYLAIILAYGGASQTLAKEWFPLLAEESSENSIISIWDSLGNKLLSFRNGHNLEVGLSYSRGSIGYRRRQDETIYSDEYSEYRSQVYYTFNLPIYYGFGYFLGTSFAYSQFLSKYSSILLSESFKIPGFLFGLCFSFSKQLRVSAGIDFYVERFSNVSLQLENSEKIALGFFLIPKFNRHDFQPSENFLIIDWFHWGDQAIRLKYSWKALSYISPLKSTNTFLDASINNKSRIISLAWVSNFN